MKLYLLSTSFFLCATFAAAQQPSYYKHDLTNCRFDNGRPMDKVECEAIRRRFAEEARRHAEQAVLLKAEADRYEAERAAETAKRQEAEARRKEVQAAIDARRKADAEQAKAERDYEERQAELATRAAARKEANTRAVCGSDYRNPRIGMRIDRAQQCVTAMRVTGQINRADGVVTTYQGGGAYFHVMDGLIVAWGQL